jgi:hypothetical protein
VAQIYCGAMSSQRSTRIGDPWMMKLKCNNCCSLIRTPVIKTRQYRGPFQDLEKKLGVICYRQLIEYNESKFKKELIPSAIAATHKSRFWKRIAQITVSLCVKAAKRLPGKFV